MDIALPGLWSLAPIPALIGILIYIGLSIGSGKWVPRSSHERELAAANRRGDEWKETALATRQLNTEMSKSLNIFAESSKTPAEFFGTLMRDGGGSSVAQAPSPKP